jgi:RNA polymerase sigma-70 factor (ECF subfamily)
MGNEVSETQSLAERVRQGDRVALEQLWAINEDRLRRMAELRLDRRLEGRVEVDQLLREAFAEAAQRSGECPQGPKSHPILWLRALVAERLAAVHRERLHAVPDEVGLDVSLYREALPTTTSASLAAQLLGQFTSPTQAAVRAGRILRLQESLNAMDRLDRDVLTLRHFEHLTLAETASELGIEESVVAKRYILAMKQLKQMLAGQ